MTSPVSPTNTKLISEAIAKLRSCSQVNVQSNWFCQSADLNITDVPTSDKSFWNVAHLNEKDNIAWAGGKKVLWLTQKVVVPQDLHGYGLQGLCLRLALVWWADLAHIYVNGDLVAEGDLFDCSPRVLLSREVTPGDEFTLVLRLVSPGHDNGALVKSVLVYESNDVKCPEPGFVADELAVILLYLERFAPDELEVLGEVLNRHRYFAFPWVDAEDAKEGREEVEGFLVSLRKNLIESRIHNLPSKIQLVGHAHLDLAWLWPVSETWQAAVNTFESVLKLQEDFPELIFCHSTPALYAWVEEHRPDLFAKIQAAVAAGRWEVLGAFWVEPELNLIAGESIVRQLLYGQRYIQEKFGKVSPIVWVPDTFGFCATLPQFFLSAGVEYFVTQKLRWNDTTKFDYGTFCWRSPDGSEVFSMMSALIGEGIDAVKMAAYALEWEAQTGLSEALWLPGVGDHGGGPTRDMLETACRFDSSPFLPKLEFTTALEYLEQIRRQGGNVASSPSSPPPSLSPSPLPTWEDELYLEFHRGCYTTHGDQKRWNRKSECLLYEAELFAALANISCGVEYPKAEIEAAWKKVLFNQFHDILPGSSITEVYTDALPEWQEVERIGTQILQNSLMALASEFTLPTPPHPEAQPIFVFNSLNWQRSEVVALDLCDRLNWTVCDFDGQLLPSQYSGSQLLFLARDIPSVGCRVFWLCPQKEEDDMGVMQKSPEILIDGTAKARSQSVSKRSTHSPLALPFAERAEGKARNESLREFLHGSYDNSLSQFDAILENEFLRVIIDRKTGNLASVFDKVNGREVLAKEGGNQLQAFQDSGQYWDAWNIDPNYAQHPLPPMQLKSIEWLESGTVRSCVRVVQQLGESEFCCNYILDARSPMLKIATTVNWQERQVLVKAAFPLNIEADFATYEIPCGAIERPTKPQTPAEQAKWEVPALRWADLTDSLLPNQYGVSLLNDCKYGYDSQTNQLRLTLLRSPNWPDPEADRGFHEFTYALYPHAGSWETAHTVRRGYELNTPLQVILNPVSTTHSVKKGLIASLGTPERVSFLDLSAENLILMAFKQAEDDPQQWIFRCYECHGVSAELSFQSDLGLSLVNSVDLLEQSVSNTELLIQPWKIASFKVMGTYS
ncbi:MAG: alpha-mannosidase [Cyanomargarita calcarea GSE-NOS-MK-12-04C]|jgi:alpha-mannosidase|uniref:Alpha-mannosidase n=1 Tax=Cyanomargarita calcarea GSE-NOS-MK-12-04C TaxID=2839659 RepID=A0A951QK04_9CYAN|nr:alpha-mannosidase [Cyanomargarita calcarea GSE-NOS-MK-12-04C]